MLLLHACHAAFLSSVPLIAPDRFFSSDLTLKPSRSRKWRHLQNLAKKTALATKLSRTQAPPTFQESTAHLGAKRSFADRHVAMALPLRFTRIVAAILVRFLTLTSRSSEPADHLRHAC